MIVQYSKARLLAVFMLEKLKSHETCLDDVTLTSNAERYRMHREKYKIGRVNWDAFDPINTARDDREDRQKRYELTLRHVEMDGFKMNQVKVVNFLGVILYETRSWKPHICQVASKVSKSVGVIRKSSFCLTRTVLCVLYTINLFILIFNIAF